VHATRLLLLLCMPLVALAPAGAAAQNGRPPSLSAEAVLLLDPEGRALYAKNADADRAPASLVKLMTLYVACEDIEAGRIQDEERVTVSAHAARTPRYRMGLRKGEQVSVRVLLEGVAIASANDAATALAERIGGDEAAFVARMNEAGRRLGLKDTRFANPHGLPDPVQRSTARDMATLTARLLRDCEVSRTLLGGQTFIWRGRVYTRRISLFDDPGGVQALKTGFTNEAGYNLAVSAWRGGQQFLMVLLGARTRARSFLDAKRLLWFGFVEAGLESPRELKKRPPRRPVRTRRTRGTR
jgi:D-alanyl-D-alanine carboxypeptidase (penicillin-binding protein 5/6)